MFSRKDSFKIVILKFTFFLLFAILFSNLFEYGFDINQYNIEEYTPFKIILMFFSIYLISILMEFWIEKKPKKSNSN